MKLPSKILRDARDLISDPARWTQGTAARDKLGRPVPSTSFKAQSWCAYGALRRASPCGIYGGEALRFLNDATIGLGAGSVVVLNDNHPNAHSMVLSAFDKAILRAKKEGK